ncbi:MAG: decaprenyl-phosphate phosphoribosyltransferase [Aggregatilineales bacterium]
MGTLLQTTRTLWRTLPDPFRGLIRAMRLRQWSKNAFIFAAILFDGQLFTPYTLLRVIVGFFLLCLVASSIYLINDVVDVERDRLHPKKKLRPIPSGQLPISLAITAGIALPIVGIGGALLYSVPLALVLLAYLALHIAYSFYLKNIVLIDVFAIAAGFILRVLAGVVVITISNFSPWLYVCAGALSLFLAVGKRRQELILLTGNGNAGDVRATYKEYNLALLDDMLRLVTTSCVLAYTFYTFEAKTSLAPNVLLLTVPFVVYGIFRYLYLIHVKGEGGAPDELLFKDKALLIDIILWVLSVILLIYVFR